MATISVSQKKLRKDTYVAELTIANNTSAPLSGYSILCNNVPSGITIDKIKHCAVAPSGIPNQLVLIPDKKINPLPAGKTEILKFSGSGGACPTEFVYSEAKPSPTPPPGPGPGPGPTPTPPSPDAKFLHNLPLTDMTDIKQLTADGFKFQWSIDKQKGFDMYNPNPDYFKFSQPNGLEINLYEGDKPFESGSPTEPRSELRSTKVILANTAYTLSFDRFLVDLPTFDFGFCQVFGDSGPNLILRWRSGNYELLQIQGEHSNTKFPGNPSDDVGKWTNYRIDFSMAVKGYVRLYRNNILISSFDGDNCGDCTTFYLKIGTYAQQMKPSNNVKIYLKNLFLYSV